MIREDVLAVESLILDEINVDILELVEGDAGLVKRRAKANFRVLGKKVGKQMKAVAAVIAQMNDADISAFLDAQGAEIEVDGQSFALEPDDVLIETQELEGWAVARESGVTVALDTELTDELRAKGMAREVINRIQNMRKQADFEVTDRIRVEFSAAEPLAQAMNQHHKLIQSETLCAEWQAVTAPGGSVVESFDIGGESLQLGVAAL